MTAPQPSNATSDKGKAVRCLVNVLKMPITRFEMIDDRPGFKSARARQAVFTTIAGKANSDGTGAFLSDSYLRGKNGFSERHLRRLRNDLQSLVLISWTEGRGRLEDDKGWGSNHYVVSTAEDWPRRHVIGKIMNGATVPKDEPHPNLNADISTDLNTDISTPETDLNADISNLNQDISELNADISALNQDISSPKNGATPEKSTTTACTAPLIPPIKNTAHQPTAEKNLVGRLALIFSNLGHGILSRVGEKELLKLAEKHSAEVILDAFKSWARRRSLDGLKHPLLAFVKEFAEAMAMAGEDGPEMTAAEMAEANRFIDEQIAKERAAWEVELAKMREEEAFAELHRNEI